MHRSIIGVAIFLVIFVGFTLWELDELRDRPVTISDPRWECDDQHCLVRFMVQNETDELINADVVITARARRPRDDMKTVTIVQVGQGVLNVELQPHGSRAMVYGFEVVGKPEFISVKAVGDES